MLWIQEADSKECITAVRLHIEKRGSDEEKGRLVPGIS